MVSASCKSCYRIRAFLPFITSVKCSSRRGKELGPVFSLDKDAKEGKVLPEAIMAVRVRIKRNFPGRRWSKAESH